METAPFTATFQARLKEDIQGGTMSILKGRIVDPQFVCCLSGFTVGIDKDPVARLIVAPTEACVGDNITANPCNSYHPQSLDAPAFVITDYQVEWGDGAGTGWLAFGGCVAHNYAYAAAGVYTVTLTVRDDHGPVQFGTASVQVLITECPGDGGAWEEGAFGAGLYAGCGASGVWFSEDGGLNWVGRGLDGILIRDLKVNPFTLGSVFLDFDVDGNPYVVNAESIELWAATEEGLFKSADGGLAWTFIPLPVPPELSAVNSRRFHVRAIKPSPVDPNEIYLAVDAFANHVPEYFAWAYRTTDGGDTWTTLRIGPTGWENINGGVNGRANTVFIDSGPLAIYDGTLLVGCDTCWDATLCEAINRALQYNKQLGPLAAWDNFGLGIDSGVHKYLREPPPSNTLWACGEMDDTCGVRATGVIQMDSFGNWVGVPGHGFAHADSGWQRGLDMAWDDLSNRLWVVGLSDTLWAIAEYYDTGLGAWTVTPGSGLGDGVASGDGNAIVLDSIGDAYVGGNFDFCNGGATACGNIAKYDKTANTWAAVGTGTNDDVEALALDDDGIWLYIGGNFTTFNGIVVNRFCRYNVQTEAVETLGLGINQRVWTITISPDGAVYIGGTFTTDGEGNAANRIAVYYPDSDTWDTLGTGMNDIVWDTVWDDDESALYAAGRFTQADGNVVNYVSRFVAGQATLPAEGRTHIIDMDIYGQSLYIGALTTGGNPFVAKIAYDLSGFQIIYNPGAGAWGGVHADLHRANAVWLFGDFGAVKLQRYVVSTGTLEDLTDALWTGTDLIRPLLQSQILARDLVAIENIAAGVARAWQSLDTATNWVDLGVVDDDGGAFLAQCGARDFISPANVLIGASTVPAANHHLRWSPNNGYDWFESSGGIIPTTAPITSIIVVA